VIEALAWLFAWWIMSSSRQGSMTERIARAFFHPLMKEQKCLAKGDLGLRLIIFRVI
jgi:hypothetical protein